jgi:hypothetical protein
MMTEPELVTINDGACVDNASLIAHLNVKGQFSLNQLWLGELATMRSNTRLLSGETRIWCCMHQHVHWQQRLASEPPCVCTRARTKPSHHHSNFYSSPSQSSSTQTPPQLKLPQLPLVPLCFSSPANLSSKSIHHHNHCTLCRSPLLWLCFKYDGEMTVPVRHHCLHTHTHTQTHTNTHKHTRVHTHKHTNTYTYTHIHIHIHIHTLRHVYHSLQRDRRPSSTDPNAPCVCVCVCVCVCRCLTGRQEPTARAHPHLQRGVC